MNKKRIIMYVYGDISTDARVHRSASTLASSYNVTVISNNRGSKSLPNSGYTHYLVGKRDYNLRNYIVTILDAIRYIKKEQPDILYGHDYYSALLLLFFLKRKKCKKIVYDAHELYVPEKGKPFSFRSRIFYWIEKAIVKKVDLLICASEERGYLMQKHYNLPSPPLTIRNISKLNVISEKEFCDDKNVNGFLQIPGKTLVYAGVVVKSRRLDELIRAAGTLSPEVKLLIVGGGNAVEELKELAVSYPNLQSLFTGPLPFRELGYILSKCDLGFIYYPVDTLNNIYCASNKLYEYASVNLPIVSNNNPTIKKALEQYKIGEASDDLLSAVRQVLENYEVYHSNCSAFNKDFNWETEARRLQESMQQL